MTRDFPQREATRTNRYLQTRKRNAKHIMQVLHYYHTLTVPHRTLTWTSNRRTRAARRRARGAAQRPGSEANRRPGRGARASAAAGGLLVYVRMSVCVYVWIMYVCMVINLWAVPASRCFRAPALEGDQRTQTWCLCSLYVCMYVCMYEWLC